MRFEPAYSKMLQGLCNYERNTGQRHPRSVGIKDSKRAVATTRIQYSEKMWTGPIFVGNPPVQFNVNFDTGSGGFFLATKGCEGGLGRTLYDPSRSFTAIPLSKPFRIRYEDGSGASGELYKDTVTIGGRPISFGSLPATIGGITATQQTLGAASKWRKLRRSPDDGVMGLAFRAVSSYNADPVLQNLIDRRLMDSPVFALKLVEGDAVLTLGGMSDNLYDGDITYVDVINDGWWEVKADSLSVDGQVIIEGIPCIIDSACSN
jgi:cathepsin D